MSSKTSIAGIKKHPKHLWADLLIIAVATGFFILGIWLAVQISWTLTGLNAENHRIIQVQVTLVYDGDTFHALVAGQDERIRLIGVDTPELTRSDFFSPYNAEGLKARDYTAWLIYEKVVYLEINPAGERDSYGRLLAYVWLVAPPESASERQDAFLDNTLNGRLIRDGMAEVQTVEPNTTYASVISAAAENAQKASLGLWPTGCFADQNTGLLTPYWAVAICYI